MENKEYFLWLYTIVYSDDMSPFQIHNGLEYFDLFETLFNIPFHWPESIPNDENRAIEGLQLRQLFVENGGFYNDVENIPASGERLVHSPCSTLEMMIALAKKIEENIMYNPEEGDRTSLWFWDMIRNLWKSIDHYTDISVLSDGCFNENDRDSIIHTVNNWYDRLVSSDGIGSPFPLQKQDQKQDLQEIWYQMLNYYNENMSENGWN